MDVKKDNVEKMDIEKDDVPVKTKDTVVPVANAEKPSTDTTNKEERQKHLSILLVLSQLHRIVKIQLV